MTDLNHFYTQRKNEFIEKTTGLQRKIRLIATARIFVALLFIVLIYLSFDVHALGYALFPVAFVFVYFVSAHSKIQEQLSFLQNLIKLNELELRSIDQDYSEFENGSTYSNAEHNYSYDLDLFGQGSLFQYINRCGTSIGEDHLASSLTSPRLNREEIESRQEGIKDLSTKIELRQSFWAHGLLSKDRNQNNNELFGWLRDKDHVFGRLKYKIILIVFPVIALILLGFTISNIIYLPLLLLSFGVQLTITSFHAKMVNAAGRALTRYQEIFNKYSCLLDEIDKVEFSSSLLIQTKENAKGASQQIRKFSKLVNAFESRKNPIAYGFGNSLYLYDLQYIYRLEKWRSENAKHVEGWFEKIAEADELISLATFHFNNPQNTFAEIRDQFEIEAHEVGHPLISQNERINNSFDIKESEKIMLITGANMAGKSTFLRTVGVNLVLALTGSSVCASKFKCPMIKLATSMRATDSLVEHQSYFYAELNRLKGVMENVHSGDPFLILLDEILRGTNSNDKHDGSVGLVKQFVSANALVMLASHDIALGELANEFPKIIRNFCFESEIQGDALTFDYKLHSGIAHKANATFLMRKMGILPLQNQ